MSWSQRSGSSIPVAVPCWVRGRGAVEGGLGVRLCLHERPLLRLVVEQPQDGRCYNLKSLNLQKYIGHRIHSAVQIKVVKGCVSEGLVTQPLAAFIWKAEYGHCIVRRTCSLIVDDFMFGINRSLLSHLWVNVDEVLPVLEGDVCEDPHDPGCEPYGWLRLNGWI